MVDQPLAPVLPSKNHLFSGVATGARDEGGSIQGLSRKAEITMVDYLSQWLEAPAASDQGIREFLSRLAGHFGAEGAGLVGPFPGPCHSQLAWWKNGQVPEDTSFPWWEEEVIENLQTVSGSQLLERGKRTWVLSSLGEAGSPLALVWLNFSAPPSMAGGDGGLLSLAGHALWRGLNRARDPHPWALAMRSSQTREQLERSARLVGKLAHDFGNLLTGVLGFAELTLNQLTPGTLPHQFLKEVCDSGRQGASWVHKLQAFSRRGRPMNVRSDLAEAVARQEARIRSAWQGKAELAVQIAPDLPPVALDLAAVQTILENLLENALEALEQPGTIQLRVRTVDLSEQDCLLLMGKPRPGRFVELELTDPGRGVPEILQAGKLDEAFIAHRRRHRGLGLAVVYGILASTEGAIGFAPSPGKGSIVRVVLPINSAAPPEAEKQPPPPRPAIARSRS